MPPFISRSEPYIPLSRVQGGVIVASLSGESLAPILYPCFTEVTAPPKKIEVTTLRKMVGAAEAPTIREVFMAA